MAITKEDWKDYGKMAKNIGIALAAALFIAVLGSSLKVPFLVAPVSGIIPGVGAWLETNGSNKKTRLSAVARWSGLGLLFGILSYAFS